MEATRARLRALVETPAVREALFVASPALETRIDAWCRDPKTEAGTKAELALARYALRMTGRATPFGLFAAGSVGRLSSETRLRVGGPCRRHTRLDMDYVTALAAALAQDPCLRPALKFRPNSSLYRIGPRARYREVRRGEKGWSHHRAALEVPDYLDVVLARARGGSTPAELVSALLDHDPASDRAEAAEYVADLIDQQVLESELVPALTGPEPIHGLIASLSAHPAGASAARCLAAVRDDLASLDEAGLGCPPSAYRSITEKLRELPVETDASRIFQVDLARPVAQPSLGANVVAELARGAELLRRLTPRPFEDELKAFRAAFVARFGDTPVTREIPLAEALDDETGVGFGEGETVEASPLLEDIDLAKPVGRPLLWSKRESHLLARLTDALSRGDLEISLTEADVEQLETKDAPPLPEAFAAMGRIEAASEESVSRGEFRLFLASASGPSGARMLGRFCHADPALHDAVVSHLEAEESLHPDRIYAEVVHLPEGRVGNILARPVCRGYEIPYLGQSGAPPDRQIPLDDLTVSVEGDRIVLRSKRLGVEVTPRLSTAHNYTGCHGVYRFLCALQGQGVASNVEWDWGPLESASFLPRVRMGRLVLSRARWRVPASEASSLLTDRPSDRFVAVQRWCEARRLPRWVCLVDGDNELPIDLDDPLLVDVLLDRLHPKESADLCEMFPSPDLLCAGGPEGRYVHEIVVPFVATSAAPTESPPAATCSAASTLPRVFAPGSEWLSFKAYAGSLTVERLARDVLGPLACDLVAQGAAQRWFFVRYADPDGHLRVRLRGHPRTLASDAVPRLEAALAPFLADGSVWKVQIDTYEQEVERYGGPAGIEPCEALFHHDSEAAVALLGELEGDRRGDLRWRLLLLGMDRTLDDLGLDLLGKRDVVRLARDAAAAGSGTGGEESAKIGAKFRAESAKIAALLDGRTPGPAHEILERRSRAWADATESLRLADREGRLTRRLAAIAPSLLHMQANRLLRTGHALHERVLYDFLFRCYEGQRARRSAAPPAQGVLR